MVIGGPKNPNQMSSLKFSVILLCPQEKNLNCGPLVSFLPPPGGFSPLCPRHMVLSLE